MAGSVNRTTVAMVLKAAKLVKRGKAHTMGNVYQQDAPAFGSRGWRMTIPGLPTGGPFGAHKAAALGHLGHTAECAAAVAAVLQVQPEFCLSYAKAKLFYIKQPA